ncbi:uncharacterized protein TNCV_1371 [Trichonephila clavipes]|nr:uncharacterized protein TNCV_1371 [Trichonephila clavipes]
MFQSSSLPIILNCFLRLLVLPIYHQSKTCGPCLHNDWDSPPAATRNQLWQYGKGAYTAVPQGSIQSFVNSMPRCVAVIIANNGGYTSY